MHTSNNDMDGIRIIKDSKHRKWDTENLNENKRKTETDRESKLALHIIWGPVGYHSIWRHKAELAVPWKSSQTAPMESMELHES